MCTHTSAHAHTCMLRVRQVHMWVRTHVPCARACVNSLLHRHVHAHTHDCVHTVGTHARVHRQTGMRMHTQTIAHTQLGHMHVCTCAHANSHTVSPYACDCHSHANTHTYAHMSAYSCTLTCTLVHAQRKAHTPNAVSNTLTNAPVDIHTHAHMGAWDVRLTLTTNANMDKQRHTHTDTHRCKITSPCDF
jgi:hypothetical protein